MCMVRMEMHGHKFAADMQLLALGGCDMMLGVDWMNMHNPVLFDFIGFRVLFQRDGESIEIQGIKEACENGTVQLISCERVVREIRGKVEIEEYFMVMAEEGTADIGKSQGRLSEHLNELLIEFADHFVNPKGWPPVRDCDHKILLLEGAGEFTIL